MRNHGHVRGGLAAALALSLLLTGCGSTLEESNSEAADGGIDAGLSAGAGSDGAGSTGGGSLAVGGLDSATSGGDTTGPGGGAATASTGGAAPVGSTGAAAPGGTGASAGGSAAITKRIKVGLIVIDNTALAAGFGAEGTDATKPTDDFVKYLNKTGGFAGRQIDPVYYKVDGTRDASTVGQEACEKFKDAKAELVLTLGAGDVLSACLGRAGVVVIDFNTVALDGVDVARFRNRFLPNAMRIDRLFGANMKISAQRGLLKKGDVLGILREDCIWGQRTMKNTMLPLAEQMGVKVVQGTHSCIQNLAADIGPVTQDIQREVLRFYQQGVTKVMFLSTAEAFALSRFSNTASQQKYYPKYLVTSVAYPYTNSRDGATINIAKDALPNIYGVGYLQMFDVGDNDTPPTFQLKERARCKEADPSQLGASNRTDNQKYFLRQQFWAACDGFFTARAMIEITHGDTSVAAMTEAYRVALGHGKKVSAGLAGGYHEVTSTRADGAGFLRPTAWNAAKNSFLYTGPVIAVP